MATRTAIGTERLQAAQTAAGLTNENVARRLDVTEKTWRRWKASGEVPVVAVRAVEEALGVRFDGALPVTAPTLASLDARQTALESRLREVLEQVAANASSSQLAADTLRLRLDDMQAAIRAQAKPRTRETKR